MQLFVIKEKASGRKQPFSVTRLGLWNEPSEKEALHKHTHRWNINAVKWQSRSIAFSPCILFLCPCLFLYHNINAQLSVFQSKTYPLQTPVSKGRAQRVACTRVTHHAAEHLLDQGNAVSHIIHSWHAPGHEYRTPGLWRWVRRSLLTPVSCEKLVFFSPTSIWLRSLIMVTKTMALVLSMASYACCGSNVNHTTPPFYAFLSVRFGAEAVNLFKQ